MTTKYPNFTHIEQPTVEEAVEHCKTFITQRVVNNSRCWHPTILLTQHTKTVQPDYFSVEFVRARKVSELRNFKLEFMRPAKTKRLPLFDENGLETATVVSSPVDCLFMPRVAKIVLEWLQETYMSDMKGKCCHGLPPLEPSRASMYRGYEFTKDCHALQRYRTNWSAPNLYVSGYGRFNLKKKDIPNFYEDWIWLGTAETGTNGVFLTPEGNRVELT